MCLLVTQTADVKFDDDFLSGVYMKNSDGIGVMFSDDKKLFIRKYLPKTEKQFIQFYREHVEGRNCAWHARMRTHGDIDMNNCHPYPVLTKEDGYPLYLAHNGVLHTGNKADTRKSDTWHFINDFLRPMLLKNPEFFKHPSFSELVGEYIGTGNKFVLLDAYGDMVTINSQQGVEYNGAWLSNTYAWDTTGTKFDLLRKRPSGKSLYGHGGYGGYGYGGYGGYGQGLNDDGSDDLLLQSMLGETQDDASSNVSASNDDAWEEDEIDFLCSFFDAIREVNFTEDNFSWDIMQKFYQISGTNFSWMLLDDIVDGVYNEQETLEIIYSMVSGDDDEDEDDATSQTHAFQTQSEVNKEVTVE